MSLSWDISPYFASVTLNLTSNAPLIKFCNGKGRPKNTRERDPKEMWSTGYKYRWGKMEAAAQNRAEDGEEWSVPYVPPEATRLTKWTLVYNFELTFAHRCICHIYSSWCPFPLRWTAFIRLRWCWWIYRSTESVRRVTRSSAQAQNSACPSRCGRLTLCWRQRLGVRCVRGTTCSLARGGHSRMMSACSKRLNLQHWRQAMTPTGCRRQPLKIISHALTYISFRYHASHQRPLLFAQRTWPLEHSKMVKFGGNCWNLNIISHRIWKF